ncbi:MAG: hypothetical protein KJO07_20210, partial [Deltaproteobacteria bacterium]|nr:hypothetical protein [Deltaproteobacteria bacterium]
KTAEPRRRDLELCKKLAPLGEVASAAAELSKDSARAGTRADELAVELKTARVAESRAAGRDRAAGKACKAARAHEVELAPALDRARDIEARLQTAESRDRDLQLKVASATKALSDSRQAARAALDRRAALLDESAELERWLEEHLCISEFADNLELWQSHIVEHGRAVDSQVRLRAQVEELSGQADESSQARDVAAKERDRARRALDEARAAAEAARERCAELPADKTRKALDGARAEQAQISGWLTMANEAAAATEARTAAQAQIEACQGRQARASSQADSLTIERTGVVAAHQEADATLRRLQQALSRDVVAMRAELEDGEPCTVCGSTEHPYATGDSLKDSLLAEQQERTDRLRDQLLAIDSKLARSQEEKRAAAEELAMARGQSEAAAAELAALSQRWAERGSRELQGLEQVDSEATRTWLRGREQALAAELERLVEHDEDARTRQAQLGEAESRVSARQNDLDQVRERFDVLAASHGKLDSQLQAARDKLVYFDSTVSAGIERLAPLTEALAILGLPVESAALSESLVAIAGDYRQTHERRADIERKLLPLVGTIERLAVEAERLAAELEVAETEAAAHGKALAALRQSRLDALGGKTVAEVEGELRLARERAAEEQASASKALVEARSAAVGIDARHQAAAADSERLAIERAAAKSRLQAAAEQLGIEID